MVQITSSEQQPKDLEKEPEETKWSEKKINAKWLWIGLGILLLILVISSSGGTSSPTTKTPASESPKTESRKLSIGEEGIINFREDKNDCSGKDEVLLGITKEAQDKVGKALSAQDWIGVAQLLSTGEAFSVDLCTKAKVIDSAVFLRQVRILEGENFGKAGWIPYEWIK